MCSPLLAVCKRILVLGLFILLFAPHAVTADDDTQFEEESAREIVPTPGQQGIVDRYEAEYAQLGGQATVVGFADQSDRIVGDLGGEASNRQAVTLGHVGDSITIAPHHEANAVVIRYSVPDTKTGGATASLNLEVVEPRGEIRFQKYVTLTSRYAWLYGTVKGGTHLYNIPVDAAQQLGGANPTHLYDEIQLKLDGVIRPGERLRLQNSAGAVPVTVDFVELEAVPEALSEPLGFISLTDPQCGGLAVNLDNSNHVFNGHDDSAYGRVFNSAYNTLEAVNPYNPTSFFIPEKVWYSTATTDALQDTTPNKAINNLSMFALADHNYQSLMSCISLVATSQGALKGVYIPKGLFYARGIVYLPSDIIIRGAGMWQSKFAAVDTEPPQPVTVNGKNGYASTSGDLIFTSQRSISGEGVSDRVILSDFSLFGNVTQRDTVDYPTPFGIRGQFTNSLFENIWVEHYFIGIDINANSSNVRLQNMRVRNTFADGIDFYGNTSNSKIDHSESRSTGDDGFALWSQGIGTTLPQESNLIINSHAELQWYGDGFAVYGGTGNKIENSSASDILNYPCLQASTQFVPPTLSAVPMTAAFSNLNFYRCGGDGFYQQFGAVLIGVDHENIDGIMLKDIKVFSPTYSGINFRPIGTGAGKQIIAGINKVFVKDVMLVNAPDCASVNSYTAGSAAFDNVCSCPTLQAAPANCAVSNQSPNTFQIVMPAACKLNSCRFITSY